MKRLLLGVLAGAVLLTGAGCGLLEDERDCGALPIAACSPIPPRATDVWPEGQDFHATSYVEDGATKTFVPGTELSVKVRQPYELEVYAGCNTLGIKAHLEDGGRLVADHFAATKIGCLDDRAAQDAWLGDFFEASPEWSLDGEDLVLRNGIRQIRLTPQD